jgi:hypothetical protein
VDPGTVPHVLASKFAQRGQAGGHGDGGHWPPAFLYSRQRAKAQASVTAIVAATAWRGVAWAGVPCHSPAPRGAVVRRAAPAGGDPSGGGQASAFSKLRGAGAAYGVVGVLRSYVDATAHADAMPGRGSAACL